MGKFEKRGKYEREKIYPSKKGIYLWLSEKEEKIYDLGWLIGFFVGEGCICITKKGKRHIEISQKEKEPLIHAKRILKGFNINCKIEQRNRRDVYRRNIYQLRFSIIDSIRFIFLLDELNIYSSKREKKITEFIDSLKKLGVKTTEAV